MAKKEGFLDSNYNNVLDKLVWMEKRNLLFNTFLDKKGGEVLFLFSCSSMNVCCFFACRILLFTVPDNCSCPSYLAVHLWSPVSPALLLNFHLRADVGPMLAVSGGSCLQFQVSWVCWLLVWLVFNACRWDCWKPLMGRHLECRRFSNLIPSLLARRQIHTSLQFCTFRIMSTNSIFIDI